jgi:hypothetical protein
MVEDFVVEDESEGDVPARIRATPPQSTPLAVATAGSWICRNYDIRKQKKRGGDPPSFPVRDPTLPPPLYSLKPHHHH